jgi:LDH2 family malate/lactate/ureidoglycolate dehydrogenase
VSDRDRTYGRWWNWNEDFVTVSASETEAVCRAAFEHAGADTDDASYLAHTYLDKALQGDHARGVGRVPAIVAQALAGELDLRPVIDVVRDHRAIAVIDGGRRGNGRLVCRRGMALASERAQEYGIGMVGARTNGENLGAYALQAVNEGMIGAAMLCSAAVVAPLGGFQPLLGNAPVAIGVPARGHDPVVLDMSCTNTSVTGVRQAAAEGRPVPEGFILDERGRPTTDPEALMKPNGLGMRGSLVPLGGGHKGYGLVFVISLLSMVLTETSPPWQLFYDLEERGEHGTLLMAIDPSAFVPDASLPDQVDAFIDRVAAAPHKDGVDQILYPGQGSQDLRRANRERDRLSLPSSQYQALAEMADWLGASLPTTGAPQFREERR